MNGNAGIAIATYKPMSGGRFRHNQSGEVLSANQVKSHRKRKIAEQLQHINRTNGLDHTPVHVRSLHTFSPKAQMLTARIDYDSDAYCPHCSRINFRVKPGEVSCGRCGKNFIAVKNW